MSFNDDEPIKAFKDVSGEFVVAGKTKASIINKKTAPLEKGEFKVLLELKGAAKDNVRSGVDLVTILDVSGSMRGDKLAKMKTAMLFMIKKLSPIDRLSVVTFDKQSRRLCPLRQINETSQAEIETLVNALVANNSTNITAGLETGLKVLNDRSLSIGRVPAIMLMTDGEQNAGADARQVRVGNLPVHTFGFGTGYDPTVIKTIADNSNGGTFSDVQNQNNLSIAFSQCLAGLLTVVVQDLKLIVTQVQSTIEKVSAGNYPQSRDDAAGPVTVSFGDLYDKEIRKVLVDLVLPAISSRKAGVDVLKITYTYSTGGKRFDAAPQFATITRTGTSVEPEREEVTMEESRLRTAKMMKEARVMADDDKLNDAQNKLMEAQNLLEKESNPLVEMLKYELQQLLSFMESPQMYLTQGRPFALSSETSHDRQRFAARGDVEKLRLFATPRMDAYLEQAKSFDKDPNTPPPTADEDVKEELAALAAASPLALIVGALSTYIQWAFQYLKSIFNMFNRSD